MSVWEKFAAFNFIKGKCKIFIFNLLFFWHKFYTFEWNFDEPFLTLIVLSWSIVLGCNTFLRHPRLELCSIYVTDESQNKLRLMRLR